MGKNYDSVLEYLNRDVIIGNRSEEKVLLEELTKIIQETRNYAFTMLDYSKFKKSYFKQKIGKSKTEYFVSDSQTAFLDNNNLLYSMSFNEIETNILNIIEKSEVSQEKKEQITQLYKNRFSEFYKTIEASSEKQDELRDLRKELKPLTKSLIK